MSMPQSAIPNTPVSTTIQPVIGAVAPLVANVTLTTPTSATLITGLTQQVTIPALAQYLLVFVKGTNATVTAAATVTLGAYQGATTGALTTLFDSSIVVAPTGGTTTAVGTFFVLPVTTAMYGTSIFISIAATASTGNFVLNASATSPTNMIVTAF